jgi:hypothetical protein
VASKAYVRVQSETDETGQITPTSLVFRGVMMEIDGVLERRQAHAVKTGGQGMRYTVLIGSHQAYLFQDDAQRWLMEEMDHVREIPHHHGG